MEDFDSEKKVAFEEFKLFYESAEKVTDRRLEANRWNYSICIAIVGAIVVIFNWSFTKPSFLITGVAAVLLLSGMAVLYCSLWIGQIRDLKKLNNAKFNIINNMANHVSFGDGKNEKLVSFKPFEKEWAALEVGNTAEQMESIDIVALKSSNIEYLIPKAFRVLFILIMIAAPFEAYRNYNVLSSSVASPTEALTVPAKP